MKMKKFFILLIALMISACSPQSEVDQQKFEAFLKTKRVDINDKARADRMLEEYKYRNALSQAISKTDVLDHDLVEAEIEEFRKELLISRYFEKYLEDAVTEQGLQNFYGNNADNYKSRKMKVSHILFRVNPRMGDTERQAQLTKAMEAHSKITAGADFAVVAKDVSEDKVSAKKGGELGWVNEGAITKAFSEKIFAMQKNELSEPFLTDYGFHIVKVLEAPQDVVKPLEAVKGDIRYQLRSQSKNAEIKRLLDTVGYEKKEMVQ